MTLHIKKEKKEENIEDVDFLIGGTFLPRTYTFPDNGVTFELRCGEVWTLDVKGLVVLYDSSEIFQKGNF